MMKQKSNCPINRALELIGDKWTLLIIRDMAFHKKQNYQDFLSSKENISTNILADRLKKMLEAGMITKKTDITNKKKINYKLTSMGVDLVPVLMSVETWSKTHLISSH
ncbi:MAG: winged helix-turn-helix transcriptional regulator [Chitinophagales bacterium]